MGGTGFLSLFSDIENAVDKYLELMVDKRVRSYALNFIEVFEDCYVEVYYHDPRGEDGYLAIKTTDLNKYLKKEGVKL